uniref:Cytoskeleton-associated protein 2 C-terminal domain-containing protein n=1 Tax=Salarias fasciatus TaxID=181472 RepID=A0A672H8H8_SALFA
MDVLAPSRRIQTSKKGNKENTQPAHGTRSFSKKDKTSAAPFQPKGNKKEDIFSTNDALKTKEKPSDPKSESSVTLKKVTAVQRNGKGGSAADIQRQTHSRAFTNEQAAKLKKISAEAPKPPTAVAPVKAAPGLYKGRIIQSKIGSIWKSSSNLSAPDPKASAARTESERVGNVAKSRSKSVSEVTARGTRQPAVARSKSAFDKRTQVTKPTASSRPPAAFSSARPAASSRPPAAFSSARPAATSRPPAAFSSARPAATSRPPAAFSSARPPARTMPATKPKVSKPAASSSLTQYRLTMETAEERRAKLAEWLASKGKIFKRPAMAASAAPAKNKPAAQPGGHPKPQSRSGDEAHGGCGPALSLDARVLDCAAPPAAHCADTQEAELPAPSRTPLVMETSLQLLEVSELDPLEGVEDVRRLTLLQMV